MATTPVITGLKRIAMLRDVKHAEAPPMNVYLRALRKGVSSAPTQGTHVIKFFVCLFVFFK